MSHINEQWFTSTASNTTTCAMLCKCILCLYGADSVEWGVSLTTAPLTGIISVLHPPFLLLCLVLNSWSKPKLFSYFGYFIMFTIIFSRLVHPVQPPDPRTGARMFHDIKHMMILFVLTIFLTSRITCTLFLFSLYLPSICGQPAGLLAASVNGHVLESKRADEQTNR